MKHYFLFLLLAIAPILLYSQNISVKSFRQLPGDMDARVTNPKTDQNGQKCAIIKVQTTETGFIWDGGMIGIIASEKKVGEYWLYIPRGAKRLTIKHDKLGILRDYPYPESIEEATVYELVLTTGKVVTTVENYQPTTQFVVITSVPDGADVFINDQHKGTTPFQQEMTEGEYSYRIVKEFYYTEAGKFTLTTKSGKKEMAINFRPNYGFVEITTKPEGGMSVTIDGVPLPKTTPLTTDRLKSGKHKITVSKTLYHEQTKDITITDNQTLKVEFDVQPSFGWINIDSNPEMGALVNIDGVETGKVTPCRIERVVSGEHTITLRKEWFEPKTMKVQVVDGKETNLPVDLQPTFGTIKIITDPESEIVIDNQNKGKGGWSGRLIAGWHTLEAKKDKHYTANQKVELVVGDDKEISLTPNPMYGKLKVVANSIGATIKLNGKEYGNTPNLISNLFVGDYILTIEKQGYGTITKTITITDAKTTEVNEILDSGKEIALNSNPLEVKLFIDGSDYGTTPKKINLGYGEHTIKLVNGNRIIEERIISSQEGSNSFNFDVRESMDVTISSKPPKALLFVNGIGQGITPKKLSLNYGNNLIKLINGDLVIEKNISVVPNGNQFFEFDVRILKNLTINSTPSVAKCYIDGTYCGITPLSTSLEVGNKNIRLEKESFYPLNQTVNIRQNTTSLDYSLQREYPSRSTAILLSMICPGAGRYYITRENWGGILASAGWFYLCVAGAITMNTDELGGDKASAALYGGMALATWGSSLIRVIIMPESKFARLSPKFSVNPINNSMSFGLAMNF